ncbi:MAG: VWA domain-containing protein [Alistipes sp.]|nr:VWA domain-containing protein [Alistipes sp.]
MNFHNPHLLWLLVLLLPLAGHYVWRTLRGGAAIRISSVDGLADAPKTLRRYLRHLPFALRTTALGLLIVALARPQAIEEYSNTSAEGIDIVLALDVSTSMLARDFKPDRITAGKEVAGAFIADRTGDRIGLVAFAGEAYTQSPLTTDQGTLQTMLQRIRCGVIEDGTAIGHGLATAINRLRESEAKSKVIILLTDGVNNRGEMAPLMAAEIARTQGIRVYTIGVGTQGMAPYPAYDIYGTPVGGTVMMKVEIDEKTLRSIAETTGGRYFRATDKDKLKAIYDEINRLEKSKVEVTEHVSYHELFLAWLLWGIGLLTAEFLVATLLLKRIP